MCAKLHASTKFRSRAQDAQQCYPPGQADVSLSACTLKIPVEGKVRDLKLQICTSAGLKFVNIYALHDKL